MPHPAVVFTPGFLAYAAIVLAGSLGMLAIAYMRAKRWDMDWKHRWEQRHGTSLANLRRRQREGMIALNVAETILAMTFLGCVGFSLWVTVNTQDRQPLLTVAVLVLPQSVLVALVYFDLLRRLTKFKVKRLDDLLSSQRDLP